MGRLGGRGLMVLGAGITQTAGTIGAGLSERKKREEEEKRYAAPGAVRGREITRELGEQAIIKGKREISAEETKLAKAEEFDKDLKKMYEIISKPSMKEGLTLKDPKLAEQIYGKMDISPAVGEGKEPISMEGLAVAKEKVEAVPSPYEEQLAGVRKEMPTLEYKYAEDPGVKKFFGREAEEKVVAQRIAAEEAKQVGKLETEEEKQKGKIALEGVRQKNREKLQGMKNSAKKEAAKVDPDKPGFKVANLELKLGAQIARDKRVKDFGVIDQQWGRMEAIWDDYIVGNKDEKSMIAVDQVLIMVFNKILDQNSVVRESEFDRTPQSEGVYERARGFLPKLKRGGVGISDKDRKEIVDTAKILYAAASDGYDRIINNYKEVFSEYSNLGVKPERITKGFTIKVAKPLEEEEEITGGSKIGRFTIEEE